MKTLTCCYANLACCYANFLSTSMLSYMMDTLQYREGAFACSWITLITAELGLLYSLIVGSDAPLPLVIVLTAALAASNGLVGMWVSLQFKWIQMQYPTIAVYFERLVVTGALPAASVTHTLVLALVVEPGDIPFYLMVSLTALYLMLVRPLQSSFSNPKAAGATTAPSIGGGRTSKAAAVNPATGVSASIISAAIQSRVDAFLLFVLTTTLPPLLYSAVHLTVFFRHSVHFYSVLLLCSAPALIICMTPKGLWWLPGSPRIAGLLRTALLIASLAVALVGFEGRVVFFAFRQYIQLHPPWDWIAVTAALLGLGAAALAYQVGRCSYKDTYIIICHMVTGGL